MHVYDLSRPVCLAHRWKFPFVLISEAGPILEVYCMQLSPPTT